jgi:hypothetical protein
MKKNNDIKIGRYYFWWLYFDKKLKYSFLDTNRINVIEQPKSSRFLHHPEEKDYLFCSFFNLVCCCIWLGIPAVIYSTRARDYYKRGDYDGGRVQASCAKIYNIIGIGVGLCAAAIAILLIIVFNR